MSNYSAIPTFRCRPGCSSCCGPHPWSKAEHERTTAYLHKRGRKELKATGLTCPYVEQHRCTIYPVRPFICRLYGTVEDLRCPHGCRPRRLLTVAAGHELTAAYVEEVNRG